MVTILIEQQLLRNVYPDRYAFLTHNRNGEWINIYKRNVLDIQDVSKGNELLKKNFYRITVTLPQYVSIKDKLNLIRKDRYELLTEIR